jgi:hypothetical protein
MNATAWSRRLVHQAALKHAKMPPVQSSSDSFKEPITYTYTELSHLLGLTSVAFVWFAQDSCLEVFMLLSYVAIKANHKAYHEEMGTFLGLFRTAFPCTCDFYTPEASNTAVLFENQCP